MSVRPSHVVTAARTGVTSETLTTAWTVLALVAVAAHAPEALRAPVVISFLALAPGLAIVRFARPATSERWFVEGLVEELALAIGISFALVCLTASVLVYSHRLSLGAVLAVVSLVTVATTLPGALRIARRPAVRRSVAEASTAAGRAVVRAAGACSPPRPLVLERLRLPTLARRSLAVRSTRAMGRLGSDALRDRLLWPTLHRVLLTWSADELRPEIWLVDDLHRHRKPTRELEGRAAQDVRGVWLTGVTGDLSVPLAWRVVDPAEGAGGHAWRSRLALDALDELRQATPNPPVVVSAAAFGSLATLRSGLESRGLTYLVKVPPATAVAALREEHGLPPLRDLPAGEARRILAAYTAAQSDQRGVLVLRRQRRLVVCADVAGTGEQGEFWLSNLPVETPVPRFEQLMRLARQPHVDRARADLIVDAMQARGDWQAMQSDLTMFALACGFRAFDASRRGAGAAG
jgi:hypothetical protein